MGPEFCWLFGRRSYEEMLGHWNAVGGPGDDTTERRLVDSSSTSTGMIMATYRP
ncbi:hypothetical protein [Nocardioides guangzhouensis]|uniref:hypothetical protein n=1 Tax=Nocardioides guangzhouensis TaxID=2497878 RepID=UPI001C376B11|nr:hypothetical protein [Nocardioides guangzhouensis]